MLPACLFEANSTPTFPHDKREQGVYFPYPELRQDAVRYTVPAGYTIEAAPAKASAVYKNLAAYSQTSSQASNTVTVRRDLIVGDIFFPVETYTELRTFYNDLEQKDHGSVVLKRVSDTAHAQASGGQ